MAHGDGSGGGGGGGGGAAVRGVALEHGEAKHVRELVLGKMNYNDSWKQGATPLPPALSAPPPPQPQGFLPRSRPWRAGP